MAWTHTIAVNEILSDGVAHVGVEFFDGVKTVRRDYSFTAPTVDDLKRIISAELERLNGITAFVSAVPAGPFDATVKPPPGPTQDELDRGEYFKQAGVLAQYRAVLKIDDPILIAQEALVKSLFKPEYYAAQAAII